MTRRSAQRGVAVSIEAAIILPGLVLFVGLVIVLAQIVMTKQAIEGAAAQAARAASTQRTTNNANTMARQTVTTTLKESRIACNELTIDTNTNGLSTPVGTPTTVTVTVTCHTTFGVSLPGFPMTKTLQATRTSPVDTYRSR